jgi:hypothetical protein
LSATRVWRSVLIMRAVDQELQKLKKTTAFSADFIAVHLNRLILHLVFNDDALRALRHDNADEAECLLATQAATQRIFPRVADYIEKHHRDNYLASFSKNLTKCEQLANVLKGHAPPPNEKQGSLFD